VEIVAVEELPAERGGKPAPDRRLAGSGDAHEDDDGGSSHEDMVAAAGRSR
jgi:hypothetical protein